jgi:hypothetical protein
VRRPRRFVEETARLRHGAVIADLQDSSMNRRPWKRLAALRAARRRGTELLPLPEEARPEPLPPLESPDDDREFLLVADQAAGVRAEAA